MEASVGKTVQYPPTDHFRLNASPHPPPPDPLGCRKICSLRYPQSGITSPHTYCSFLRAGHKVGFTRKYTRWRSKTFIRWYTETHLRDADESVLSPGASRDHRGNRIPPRFPPVCFAPHVSQG
ncbi:hypothetical protein BDM02DRAFT_3123515 [Thelephora ganbajun]|uniref:Uncharacterized protein n=1 Tax=Thelephora ganbajun TaxID=370292 RepID=A0ACB6Z113_THEGA|nr:hypothetical protein BDM02DRAFT_3123515 [Thelephora ganbajun]